MSCTAKNFLLYSMSHILILTLTFYIINALYKIKGLLLPFKTAWMPKKEPYVTRSKISCVPHRKADWPPFLSELPFVFKLTSDFLSYTVTLTLNYRHLELSGLLEERK